MGFDNAYEALTEDNDPRWAFGTGFADPLAGVDTTVPAGVAGDDLAGYCLMLGDDALVLSHRLQQWCTNAPTLEDEVALANIALDLLGQARLLLTRAGAADGSDRSEDAFAYFRDAVQFRNVQLVERENGDFAECVVRLLVFATWRLAVLQGLVTSADPVLAAIAAKGVKEVTYHRDYAAQWAVRLGDGTAESHRRMDAALSALWPSTVELFAVTAVERRLVSAGVAVDPGELVGEFDGVIEIVLRAATLRRPDRVEPADPRARRHPHGRPGRAARRAAVARPRRSGGDVVSGAADPRTVAAAVTDPELPLLTLDDLGVLGDVIVEGSSVVVALLPTYTGCPAMDVMRDDVVAALGRAGYDDVDVRVQLAPAWSSDRISAAGRRKLADAGIAPPGAAPTPAPPGSPIPITLRPSVPQPRCPRCGSADTEETSRFGATACKSLHRCRSCAEPFEYFKAL